MFLQRSIIKFLTPPSLRSGAIRFSPKHLFECIVTLKLSGKVRLANTYFGKYWWKNYTLEIFIRKKLIVQKEISLTFNFIIEISVFNIDTSECTRGDDACTVVCSKGIII